MNVQKILNPDVLLGLAQGVLALAPLVIIVLGVLQSTGAAVIFQRSPMLDFGLSEAISNLFSQGEAALDDAEALARQIGTQWIVFGSIALVVLGALGLGARQIQKRRRRSRK